MLTENTRLLSHQVSVDDFSGRASSFKLEAKEVEDLNETLTSIIAERTGQAEKKIRNDQLLGDYWINIDRAKAEGYADTIIKHTRTYRKKKKGR
ncbi:MAG TPA: hypothetical protein ENI61_04315 [Ignavibacteria bacterium]|nr:hypothetical protein [Ignavibacteria bacterium]